MPRYKAVYADGSEVEGEALDLARYVVELASGPRGPNDLILVGDVFGFARLKGADEPAADEPDKPRRRK